MLSQIVRGPTKKGSTYLESITEIMDMPMKNITIKDIIIINIKGIINGIIAAKITNEITGMDIIITGTIRNTVIDIITTICGKMESDTDTIIAGTTGPTGIITITNMD